MRDPNRIPQLLAALAERWAQDPDLRLGQLLSNDAADLDENLFYIEDSAWLESFRGRAAKLTPLPDEPGPRSRPSEIAL